MTFNEDSLAKSHETQRQKYKDYSAEMSRRAKLRKTRGHGGFRDMKLNHPEQYAKIIADREERKRQKYASKETAQNHDRTQED